jgi:hypothetical protein
MFFWFYFKIRGVCSKKSYLFAKLRQTLDADLKICARFGKFNTTDPVY